jgi:triosephosphate isomerase
MRVPFIAGNWKMNTTVEQASALAKEITAGIRSIDHVEKALCPPAISITTVASILKGTTIGVGAQNAYFEAGGAYTGEISLGMLEGWCRYVIIGHSERRQLFGDTDQVVASKLRAVLSHGFIPILCVGERLDEYDGGQRDAVLQRQIGSALSAVEASGRLVVAYEPVWAIGTGRAATVGQASQAITVIRSAIKRAWGHEYDVTTRVLYGGSVTAANTLELMKDPMIDGALVGGASLKARDFISIVTQTASAKSV